MPQLFISYTQDSPARKAEVLALATSLRALGLDVVLDQDHPPSGPPKGWPVWSGEISENAPHVLCIASKDYLDCWHGRKPAGVKNGATHEALTLQNRLYEGGADTEFLRFAYFDDADQAFIPKRVKGLSYFSAGDHASIQAWVNGTAPPVPAVSAASLPAPAPAPASIAFDYQRPAVPPVFVGRRKELTLIEHLMADGGGLSLVGDSRMGKSSLLDTVKAKALASGQVVCALDSQSLDGFVWPEIVRQFTGGAVRPTPDQCKTPDDAANLFSNWVKKQSSKPVILIDEGEGLIRELEIRFFERLRGLLQNKSLCLIMATRRDLHELFSEYRQTTSPLGNTMMTERVGLLDEADAQTLAERAGPHSGLLRLWAGASPYYLQLLGATLAEGPDEATAMRRFRDTAASRLAEQWGRLRPGEQKGVQTAVAGMAVNADLLPGLNERGLLTQDGLPFGRVLSCWIKREAARQGHV